MCDILDFRCLFVNEIVGSVALSVILLAILYFIVASKMRLGFDTTVTLAFPVVLLAGIAVAGISAILAFSTIVAGLMMAWIFNKVIGNR